MTVLQYPIGLSFGTTRLVEANVAGRRPVVLVHGMGARSDRWAQNIDFLGGLGFRVIALDLPGHGFATKGSEAPHTVVTLRDVVLEVLDYAREEGADQPAIMIGTSLGGNICAAAAIERPEDVSDLILIGSMGLERLGFESRGRFAQRVQDTSITGIRRKLTNLVTDKTLVTDNWVTEEYKINNSPGARAYLASLGSYLANDIDKDLIAEPLADIRHDVNIQLAWGLHDRSVDISIAKRVQAEFGFSLTTFKNSAHAPYLEEYTTFNSYLQNLLV